MDFTAWGMQPTYCVDKGAKRNLLDSTSSPSKVRGHERQSDCTLCNSTKFAPAVCYLSSDVLLQLHPGTKVLQKKLSQSCLPQISLPIFLFLVVLHDTLGFQSLSLL